MRAINLVRKANRSACASIARIVNIVVFLFRRCCLYWMGAEDGTWSSRHTRTKIQHKPKHEFEHEHAHLFMHWIEGVELASIWEECEYSQLFNATAFKLLLSIQLSLIEIYFEMYIGLFNKRVRICTIYSEYNVWHKKHHQSGVISLVLCWFSTYIICFDSYFK